MSKPRMVYIGLLAILGIFIVITIFQPLATGAEFSEVRGQLLQGEDEWIVQYNIINLEGRDQNYTIDASVAGKTYSENVLVPSGREYVYIHHIQPNGLVGSEVTFTFYKEGELNPFKEATYYLK